MVMRISPPGALTTSKRRLTARAVSPQARKIAGGSSNISCWNRRNASRYSLSLRSPPNPLKRRVNRGIAITRKTMETRRVPESKWPTHAESGDHLHQHGVEITFGDPLIELLDRDGFQMPCPRRSLQDPVEP